MTKVSYCKELHVSVKGAHLSFSASLGTERIHSNFDVDANMWLNVVRKIMSSLGGVTMNLRKLLIMASLWTAWNFPSAVIEAIWAAISLYGLVRRWRWR